MGTPSTPGAAGAATSDEPISDLARPFVLVAAVVAVMWAAELVDLLPGVRFDRWGIRPRTVRGLVGIPLAPFLHSGFRHLFANTIPFLVMGWAIAAGGVGRWVRVTAIVTVVSGAGVWLFARSGTVHIGASGVVFGYLTYLVARGIFARRVLWLAGGALALFVYGGILFGVVPRPGISWTGHLFGAVGGVVAAWSMHRRAPEPGDDDRL